MARARAEEALLAAGARKIIGQGERQGLVARRLAPDGHLPHGRRPESLRVSTAGVRSHDVRNLFIVDGSIFVTAGAVNPTSTIQALALYIGDRIKTNIANLFD